MARLAFGGLDFGHEAADGLAKTVTTWAAPTYDSAITRSGTGRSGKLVTTTSAGKIYWEWANPGGANGDGVENLFRVWIRFPAAPAVATVIIAPMATTISVLGSGIALNADATVSIGTTGAKSAALAVDTWHCIEHRVVSYSTGGLSSGQGQWEELRVNGIVVDAFHATNSVGNRRAAFWRFGVGATGGNVTFTSAFTCYFDDWAVNDSQGAADNTYPDTNEKVALLLPASDNAVGANWKLGDNTSPSSNAFDSVNNVPPTGKALASGAAGDQLRDAVAPTSGAGDRADFNLQTYTAAGVPSGATVKAILPFIEAGTSAANAKTFGVSLLSNPAIAEVTSATGTSTASTFNTNWYRLPGTLTIGPSGVVLGTAPVMRVRLASGISSDSALICAVGAYISYDDRVNAQTLSPTSITSTGAVGSPAVRAQNHINPASIASAAAMGTPTVIGNQNVAPAGIASAQAFGAATVAGPIKATGIPSSASFGTPDISGAVKPTGIASAAAVGTPQITGGYHRYDFVAPGSPQTTTNGITRDFPITVSGLASILDVEVSLYMTNPGGLAGNPVTLIAPNGQQVALIPANKGGTRTATGAGTQDQHRTHFDSQAAIAWGSLSNAPWVGRFRPSGNLANLNGADPNGTWRLRVADKKQGNTVNTIQVATLLIDAVVPFAAQTISVASLPKTTAVGTPTVAGPVKPTSIPSAAAVGRPAVQSTNQFAVVFGLAIPSAGAFGIAKVAGPVTVTSIASGEAVGTPTIDSGETPVQTIVPDAIDSDELFGDATLTQSPTVVSPTGIASSEVFGGTVAAEPSGGTSIGPVIGVPGPTRVASFFYDPITTTRYDWPINHSTEQPVTLSRAYTAGAPSVEVVATRQQSAPDDLLLRLEGMALDYAQIAALRDFFDRCSLSPVIFHDADGDEYDVVVIGFAPRRVRGRNPHGGLFYWRYTIDMEVTNVRAGVYA